MVPSVWNRAIAAPGPSTTDARNLSKLAGSMRLATTPRKVPFGAFSRCAIIVVQVPVRGLRAGSMITAGAFGSDLKRWKKDRSETLTAGTGKASEELTSSPSASKRAILPIKADTLTLARNISCACAVEACSRNASGETISDKRICEINPVVMISQSSNS